MSYNYFNSLNKDSLQRYKAKLLAVGLEKCPFQLAADLWTEQPAEWLNLEYGDIFIYLTSTAGK